MFKLFAELIAQHLDANHRLVSSQAELLDERKTAELREMFIAVLGHDLRNPLAAISSGVSLISRTPLNERASMVVVMMQQSIVRMSELISNMVDFARGRLGGGIALRRDAAAPLAPVLGQIIGELRASWPDRIVYEQIDLAEPVDCDRDRIGQLFSNLLSNALTYGPSAQPIRVQATAAEGWFVLSVANGGPVISPDVLKHLFEPFQRGTSNSNRQGLGLGLHIACEIALAHGGELTASSSPEETRFTFKMPTTPIKQAGPPLTR